MMRVTSAGLLVGLATAMPSGGHLLGVGFNETEICSGGLCAKPNTKYEKMSSTQPGYQWNDAGGYCGSWSIQRASLAKGAYISQQQVRSHTSDGGGNDHEILSTNIEEAFKNLKIKAEGFDYVNQPVPQNEAYYKWLKAQLVAGHPVTWMIMWDGQTYPIYDLTPPAGLYGHVEPVVGVLSNHPLTDEEVYEDDYVVHFTDGGINTVYRPFKTLTGDWAGPGEKGICRSDKYCIGPYSFGWAVKGFEDNHDALPASLHIEPWKREPDTRSGASPNQITGTLTVTELTAGSTYDIFRWDTSTDAFTYSDEFKKTSFQATNATFVYEDPTTFQSDGVAYYSCVAN